jgi:riboflavin synthase
MFTGIIQTLGRIESLSPRGGAMRMAIAAADLDTSDVALGDSIAVSGPCLTAVAISPGRFEVDVSPETLDRTTLGGKRAGDAVNLEKALRLSDRLGGHLVSGHVDGLGDVVARVERDNCVQFTLRAPQALARYIAPKGSICIDGVSLTVNAVDGAQFELLIIPHTLERTTLGELRAGSRVNLEIDLVARYLERLLAPDAAAPGGVTLETLRKAGMLGPA